MLRIQDPDLEKLLNFFTLQQEFVFLDTSRPDNENVESLLFLEPLDRVICQVDDNLENYLADLQQCLANGFYLAGWVASHHHCDSRQGENPGHQDYAGCHKLWHQ